METHAGFIVQQEEGGTKKFLIGQESGRLMDVQNRDPPKNIPNFIYLRNQLVKLRDQWSGIPESERVVPVPPAKENEVLAYFQRMKTENNAEAKRRCIVLEGLLRQPVHYTKITRGPSQYTFRFVIAINKFGFIKGTQEGSETADQTAYRELREEVGGVPSSFSKSVVGKPIQFIIDDNGYRTNQVFFPIQILPSDEAEIRRIFEATKEAKKTEIMDMGFLPEKELGEYALNLSTRKAIQTFTRPMPETPRAGKRKTYRKKKSHRKTSKAKRK